MDFGEYQERDFCYHDFKSQKSIRVCSFVFLAQRNMTFNRNYGALNMTVKNTNTFFLQINNLWPRVSNLSAQISIV